MNLNYIGKRGRKPKGNEYFYKDNYIHVIMSNTQNIMLCDKDTWEIAKSRTWIEDKQGYAFTHIKDKMIYFHRIVKECPCDFVIDHINRNTLDNRKCNLRITTSYVNLLNSGTHKNNKSGHKGIKKQKYGYVAQIKIDKETIYLGFFKELSQAIQARKEAEEKYHKPIIEKETFR